MQPRRTSVWIALWLQIAVGAIGIYGGVQTVELWSKYPAVGGKVVAYSIVYAILLLASAIGLWKSQLWGWVLSLLVDGMRSSQALSVALNHSFVARNARFLAVTLCELAAIAALLYPTARRHFLKGVFAAGNARSSPRQGTRKWIPLLAYFVVAVLVTCAASAFVLAIVLGQKNGGTRGFLFLLYVGIMTGGLAAFLFVSILTLASRAFGSARLWRWLLLGGLLAPCLVGVLGLIGHQVGTAAVIFWGPATILQVWWLTPLVGVVTGWLCFTIYPLAFAPGANSK